jgi:hypothetical protein
MLFFMLCWLDQVHQKLLFTLYYYFRSVHLLQASVVGSLSFTAHVGVGRLWIPTTKPVSFIQFDTGPGSVYGRRRGTMDMTWMARRYTLHCRNFAMIFPDPVHEAHSHSSNSCELVTDSRAVLPDLST